MLTFASTNNWGDSTSVNPFITLLIITWWLAVAFAVAWFLYSCGFFHFPPPCQRRQRPTHPTAPTSKWPRDPKEN